MSKSIALAAAAATILAASVLTTTANAAPVNLAGIADAKPQSDLVQAGFKKKHFRLNIHVGGFGAGYGHGYYDGYGYGCRHLLRRWRVTGAWIWRKRYLRCIGAF